MTRKRPVVLLGFLTLLLCPTIAYAHPGVHPDAGFVSGFFHPFTGLDHALAMIAVGVFAAHLGGRAIWAVPASFVAAMIAGGALPLVGLNLPMVEPGIAASVFVLGVLIAMQARMSTSAAAAIVGAFAVFHGYAHGSEIPAGSSLAFYIFGFVGATGLLHAAGIALGVTIATITARQSQSILRVGGGLLAGTGLFLASAAV